MLQDDKKCHECVDGLPQWMGTFADLMSLLMCFFVLLLSFSEMDVLKFKQIAGSVKFAFGVQSEVDVKGIPKGTSVVALEFSPGKPTPTAIIEVKQITSERIKKNLDFTDSEEKSSDTSNSENNNVHYSKKTFDKLSSLLQEYIQEDLITIEKTDSDILIRIRERGSFFSGSAQIKDSFKPVLDKLSKILINITNEIIVSGHSDNVPIYTERYPSNWVLSSTRAANVVHYLTNKKNTHYENLQIRAHADTRPLVLNNSHKNRALNRRVEIIIKNKKTDTIKDTEKSLFVQKKF